VNELAQPKNRISKQRKRQRRTHWKLATPGLTRCSNCSAYIKPHRICPECGHYQGRLVMVIVEKEKKNKKKGGGRMM
jgi:large subunit ribosomal protein L32